MKYSLSNAGENCENPIKTMRDCKISSELLEDAIYVVAKGDGKQLPHGCVMDKITPGKSYVYWNKNGGVKSFDQHLQTICHS